MPTKLEVYRQLELLKETSQRSVNDKDCDFIGDMKDLLILKVIVILKRSETLKISDQFQFQNINFNITCYSGFFI